MGISDCVFYTGRYAGRQLLNPSGARDALDELFTHSDGVSDEFYGELEVLELILPQSPIRVVTIAPGPGDTAFTMGIAAEFARDMSETLPQLLRQDGLFFYMNSRVQGVVNCDGEDAVRELYQSLIALVRRHGQGPHAAISNQYQSLAQISKACDENQEANLFERFLTKPIDVLVQPRDFYLFGEGPRDEQNTDDDSFFGEASQRICNAMITRNTEKMHQELDMVLEYMVGKFPRVSGVHMRAIHFCKPLEMTLVGADLIDRRFVQRSRLVQQVIEADNEALLRETFHRQMDEICRYAKERKQQNHGELMHSIADYIDGNLSDSSLSILTIAECFHMHPARLSSEFREYFNESVPGFIHQRRIAVIKQQLCTTSLPIREIAFNAGYVSIATMNRAFLKREGLYPGQYRKKNQIKLP